MASVQSLENLSLLNTCSALWRNRGLIGRLAFQLKQCYLQDDHTEYYEIANIVWNDIITLINLLVHLLSLPGKLARKVSLLMCGMKREIVRWLLSIDFVFGTRYRGYSRAVFYLSYIQWSSVGTVNYTVTSENLITRAKLSDVEKFLIACTFCLQNYIVSLAPKISSYLDNFNGSRNAMVNYWVCFLKDGLDEMQKFAVNEHGHDISVPEFMMYEIFWTNEAAVEYFWKQLNNSEIQHLLDFNIEEFHYFSSNTLFRMFSEFSDEQDREEFFHEVGSRMLIDFYKNLLLQDRYFSVLRRMSHVMIKENYLVIIESFASDIKMYRANIEAYNYFVYVLKETWFSMPAETKKSLINTSEGEIAVIGLLNTLRLDESIDFVEIILENGGPAFKKNVILNHKIGHKIFIALLKKYNLDYTKHFLKTLGTNHSKIREFKKSLMNSKDKTGYKYDIAFYFFNVRRAHDLEEFLEWVFSYHQAPRRSIRNFKKASQLVLFERLILHLAKQYVTNSRVPDFSIMHYFLFHINFTEEASVEKILKKLPNEYYQFVGVFKNWFDNRSR